MIKKSVLFDLYISKNKSMNDVADILGCSLHKVSYWVKKYGVLIGNHSEATYVKRNPDGDPFKFKVPDNLDDMRLLGMGIGLYWGGNKSK